MAISGTPDNLETTIRRAGNVAMANVTTIGPGDNSMPKVQVLFADLQTLSRDSDNGLGDKTLAHVGTNAQLTFKHTTHYPSPVAANGAQKYDIHGNFISAEAATTTTFGADEAADDNGRGDNGEWYDRRSTPSTHTYPLKTG